VCVPAVIGVLALWISNPNKKQNKPAKKEGSAPGVAQNTDTACRCMHGTGVAIPRGTVEGHPAAHLGATKPAVLDLFQQA